MKILLQNWKLLRRFAVMISVSLAMAAVMMAVYSGSSWFFAVLSLFLCLMSFAFTFSWPFLMRWISEFNHGLFGVTKPKSNGIEVALFWFSVIVLFLQSVELAAAPSNILSGESHGATAVLCAALGLFVGCGNALFRKRDSLGEDPESGGSQLQ